MLPIATNQASATGGGVPWQDLLVKLTHIGAGATLIVAWTLLIVGFVKNAAATESSDEQSN
jgi:hypothetical protein